MKKDLLALSAYNVPAQTPLIHKVGAHFLMNLFYYLDHFKVYEHPEKIGNANVLNFAEPLPVVDQIDDERFVLFRNPIDRLIAFYYQQIFFGTEDAWQDWRDQLLARGATFGKEATLRQHRKNICHLMDYIAELKQENGMDSLPDHLLPQYYTFFPAIDLGFEPIALERANFEIAERLVPYLDNIEAIIKKIGFVSAARKPFVISELVDKSIKAKVLSIYEGDFELYQFYRYGGM